MIKRWIVTGDTHGMTLSRLQQISASVGKIVPEETAVIILGDAGINYYLDSSDRQRKRKLCAANMCIYCLRGNHEARPQSLPTITTVYDADVGGEVYIEPEFPQIRYFVDGGEYTIAGKSVLTIGGAYSVDKYYRLARAAEGYYAGWFEDEQLNEAERQTILEKVTGKHFDLVLTHTTAIQWEPRDLFLPGIDQTKVDKSMELWLQKVSQVIAWGVWLFGHYHADRIEAPYVEQYFRLFEDLEVIVERWRKYAQTKKLDWWLTKGANFYAFESELQ